MRDILLGIRPILFAAIVVGYLGCYQYRLSLKNWVEQKPKYVLYPKLRMTMGYLVALVISAIASIGLATDFFYIVIGFVADLALFCGYLTLVFRGWIKYSYMWNEAKRGVEMQN